MYLQKMVFLLAGFLLMSGCYENVSLNPEEFYGQPTVIDFLEWIENSDIDAMEEYISKGGDVNVLGKHDMTPLSWAVLHNNKESVVFLIDAGANINLGGDSGRSPMVVAGLRGNLSIMKLLHKYGGDPNTIFRYGADKPLFAELMYTGENSGADYLLKNGANIDLEYGHRKTTALITFCKLGEWEMVYKLLLLGASPEIKNYFGDDLGGCIEKYISRGREPKFGEEKWFNKVRKIIE